MEKPLNRFALLLWIVAAVFLFADVPMVLAIRQIAHQDAATHGPQWFDVVFLSSTWSETRSALLGAGQLAALGVIVELIDRIRYNALPPDQRPVRKQTGVLMGVRNWLMSDRGVVEE
jgi:hypothetical protein